MSDNCQCGSPPDLLLVDRCPRCVGKVNARALLRRKRLALEHATTSLAAYHRRLQEAHAIDQRLARDFPNGPEPKVVRNRR